MEILPEKASAVSEFGGLTLFLFIDRKTEKRQGGPSPKDLENILSHVNVSLAGEGNLAFVAEFLSPAIHHVGFDASSAQRHRPLFAQVLRKTGSVFFLNSLTNFHRC